MKFAPSRCALTALACLFLGGIAAAQSYCGPLPAGFAGTNGNAPQNDNLAHLQVFTDTDSTDIFNNDNHATVSLGRPLSVFFDDARVPAGSPFLLAFSVGVPPPISVPTAIDGVVWLDINGSNNVFNLIDGFGVFGPFPNPLGHTAGPNLQNAFFANIGTNASLAAACLTMQVLIADPFGPAPFFFSMSNPVRLEIRPGVVKLTPSLTVAGSGVAMIAPGATPGGGDVVLFDGSPLALSTAGPGFITPATALSGHVSLDVGGVPSAASPDGIEDFLVVTDPAGVQSAVGNLALTPDPNFGPGFSRGTAVSTLSNPGGTHTWSVALSAGDVVTVEAYSIDPATQTLLDGVGTLVNPFATQGFDPFVQLQYTANVDALVYDTAGGPFNVHFDDDGGPENNAVLQWQTPYTANMNIIVGDANPGFFATGDYLLNVTVRSGVPSVAGFQNGASARVNIVPQGGTVTILGANIVAGTPYDVILSPRAGAPFTDRVINGVVATTNGQLSITLPAPVAGNLTLGVHQVRLIDLATLSEGLPWNNSQFFTGSGILPDLLSIRATTLVPATASNPAATVVPNTQSAHFFGGLGNGFVTAMIPANVIGVYCEALALNGPTPDLFDTQSRFGGAAPGIYNPNIKTFRPGLTTGPYNDDDGIFPSQLFDLPLGIGRNAAVVDFGSGGGLYYFLIQQNIVFNGANTDILVNICTI